MTRRTLDRWPSRSQIAAAFRFLDRVCADGEPPPGDPRRDDAHGLGGHQDAAGGERLPEQYSARRAAAERFERAKASYSRACRSAIRGDADAVALATAALRELEQARAELRRLRGDA